jgi:hypothetical protein
VRPSPTQAVFHGLTQFDLGSTTELSKSKNKIETLKPISHYWLAASRLEVFWILPEPRSVSSSPKTEFWLFFHPTSTDPSQIPNLKILITLRQSSRSGSRRDKNPTIRFSTFHSAA